MNMLTLRSVFVPMICLFCALAATASANDGPTAGLAERLNQTPKEEWVALLDRATIDDLEVLLAAQGAPTPYWGAAALRLVKLLAHVGRKAAALRWAARAQEVPGDHQEAIAALSRSMRPPVSGRHLGLLGPMTGPYAAAGKTILQAAKLAAEGTDVEIVSYDTQGEKARAAAGVKMLSQSAGVSLIVGPVGQQESKAAAVEAEREEVPIITLTRRPGITQIGTFVFRHRLTTSRSTAAVIEYAAEHLGVQDLAFLSPKSPYGDEALASAWSAARRRGLRVTGAERYSPNTRRFDDAIKGLIGRKVLDGRPPDPHWEALNRKSRDPALHVAPIVEFDAIYIADSGSRLRLLLPFLSYWDIELRNISAQDKAELAHKYAGEPPRLVYILGGPGFGASAFQRLPLKEANQALFGDVYWGDTSLGKRFNERWRSVSRRPPPALAAHAFAATRRAIAALKGPGGRPALRSRLRAPHESIFGPTTVDGGGDFTMPARVLTVDPDAGVVPAATPNVGGAEDAPP